MPKTKISEFSSTAGNNTDIDGINIAEGCAPSGINDAIRELMAQLKDFQVGAAGDSFNGPIGSVTAAAGAFTTLSASGAFSLTGDQVQISEGGTGQTTANAAFNALAPSQTGNSGKYLKTDGTNSSWDAIDINTADITGTLPVANGGTGITSFGTGVATALGINTGTAGSFVVNGGALGTPSSGTVTNLTGTASININGTVGATTANTGSFTTLTTSSTVTLNGGTANGVAFLNGSKVLTSGSVLTFDGTILTTSRINITNTGTGATFSSSGGSGMRIYGSSGTNQWDLYLNGANIRFSDNTGGGKFVVDTDAIIYGITVGRGAGAVSTNTAVGESALAANTSGSQNTAVGYQAGYSNTTSAFNVYIGRLAGYSTTTSAGNSVFVGNACGFYNTTGQENTAVGGDTFQNNTTGSYNTAIGRSALYSNTTASNNTAVGYQSLYSNTTGANSTAVGYGSAFSNTTGTVGAFGLWALRYNTTGTNNAFGFQALTTNTTGTNNSAFGYNALALNTTGNYNVAYGDSALQSNTTASNNTAVGFQAGYANTTGTENFFGGHLAGAQLTSGSYTTALGSRAGNAVITGNYNTALGYYAYGSGSSGANNTAVGSQALYLNTTASNNTAVGYQALYGNTTSASQTALGYQALYNITGSFNGGNTALGQGAGFTQTSGYSNTYVGYNSGYSMTSGIKNVILGSYSGNQSGIDIRTTSNYVVLSDGDGNPRIIVDGSGRTGFNGLAPYVSYNLSIPNTPGGNAGVRHQALNTGTSYAAEFYTSDNTSRGYISYTTSGTTYNTTSDYRLKHDIAPMTSALEKVAALKPVTYKWNADNSDGEGFIAHELAEVCPQAVTGEKDAVNEDGSIRPQGIDTSFLVATLTAAIQELKAEFDAYKAAHP